MSSGLNALAAVILEDIIKGFIFKKELSDKKAVVISKLLCLSMGIVCLLLTYLVSLLGTSILQV
jgi:Na+/proline symporter